MESPRTLHDEERSRQIRAWLTALVIIAVVAALASLALAFRRSLVATSSPVASVTWTGPPASGPTITKSAREVGSVTELTFDFQNLTGEPILQMTVTSVSFGGKTYMSTPTKLGPIPKGSTISKTFRLPTHGKKGGSIASGIEYRFTLAGGGGSGWDGVPVQVR